MDCPALVGGAGGGGCGAPPVRCTNRSAACGLYRTPSYADVVRLPPPAQQPAQQPSRPRPAAAADGQLMGRPRARLPFSQLTLGKSGAPPWHASSWNTRACRVEGDVLRVEYARGSSHLSSRPPGGCSFRARPRCLPATDVTLAYRLRLPESFEWSRGGKLPGLFMGFGEASGGHHSGTAASCRLMWRRGGAVIAYVYVPSGVRQSAAYARASKEGGAYGDALFEDAGLRLSRGDGAWNDVVVRVKLNSFDADGRPVPDGVVTVSVNQRAATFEGVIWRRRRDVRIDHIAFQTFYGGKWRAPQDTYAEFKDVSCVA